MEGLDDSLFRLRQIQRNDDKRQVITTDDTKQRLSKNATSDRSVHHLRPSDELFRGVKTNIDTSRPQSDISCIQNYPIRCVSENWEIITCHIWLHSLLSPANKTGRISEPKNKYTTSKSIIYEHQSCQNFRVYLENIK